MSTGAKPSFSWVNSRAHRTGGGAAVAAAAHGADDPGDDESGDHHSRPRALHRPRVTRTPE